MAVRRMTDHALQGISGYPRMDALMCKAKLSSTARAATPYAGSVVRLNSSGEFDLGVANTSTTHSPVAVFLLQDYDAPDVLNDGGTPSTDDNFPFVPTAPTKVNSGLVATGAYELASTEYNTSNEASMTAGRVLTASVSTGKLDITTIGSGDPICAVVSRGVKVLKATKKKAVYVWPVWNPNPS